MSRSYILIFTLVFETFIIAQPSKYETKILTDFENYIATHINSYLTNNREFTSNSGNDWFYCYYESLPNYSYDLSTTNSLVTPFNGYLEFTLIKWRTKSCKSKEEAENDESISIHEIRIHKHTYGYQNSKWVILSRENKLTTDKINKWFDCDIKKHGCREYND
jgi:hypothetical protein